jgi:dolichyl-phosphate-mannose--protein O-mannosyl transferase
MSEYLLRFVVGGVAVLIFSMLGDLFRPKSFAGLFSAAPSVALATLAIAVWNKGPPYAAIEGRSMAIASLALCAYCLLVAHLLQREQMRAAWAASLGLIVWFACAFGLKWLVLA